MHGYALILAETLEYIGVKCKYTSNHDHAWNLVQINGKWYNADITWDAEEGLGTLKHCLRSNTFFDKTRNRGNPTAKCSSDYPRKYIREAVISMAKNGFVKKTMMVSDMDMEHEK